MNIDTCDRCGEKKPLETYSYRVVAEDGTINLDVKYCTECCDEIEELMKAEAEEQDGEN